MAERSYDEIEHELEAAFAQLQEALSTYYL
jgi:hypothetical protein